MHRSLRNLGGLAAVLFLSNATQAQEAEALPCLANDPHLLEQLHRNDPEALARMAEAEAELAAWTEAFTDGYVPGQRSPYVITVVFHVIHDNGPENISDEQLYDAIRILNEDYNKLNPDWPNVKPEFLDRVADVGIEFRLAKRDPQGNCTNGITRTQSTLTYQGDYEMVGLINWPRNRYMNVWVAASANGAAGYTNYPSAFNSFPQGDGIVILHNYTGSIGTSSPFRSRVLTHEVGHWLNLPHTWGNSNEPGLESNCGMDDGVADTPNTAGWTSCALNGQSCGSLDNVENYMDYSYCSRMFTNGQGARMLAALNSSVSQRNNLWQSATLALTGVEELPELCQARFTSSTNALCAGEEVTFQDISFHGVQTRTWSFPGGTPSSSTEAGPTVVYDAPGTYPVTLTVSDGTNSLSTTTEQAVLVLADPGQLPPFAEGFEDITDLGNSSWSTTGVEDGFAVSSVAAFSGVRSVRLTNNAGTQGGTFNLISQTFDMSDASSINIGFRHAFAQRNSFNDDRLRVYVSSSCGQHWVLRKQLRGTLDLNTGGVQGGSFVPNGPAQWGYTEVANLNSTYHSSDFRVRFEFVSDGGNNLYLDDININGMPVGLEETGMEPDAGLLVVPNPANGPAQVRFALERPATTRIDVLDPLGRELLVLYEGGLAAGPHALDLGLEGMPGGIYLLRMRRGDHTEVTRFVVQ